MADEGLRVLGLAFSYLEESEFSKFNAEDDNSIEFENHLVFCGLTGLLDPPRAPVARAVAVAHGAGIRVVMITGDHPRTALAIAKRLGIALPSMSEKQVLKGKELDAMSEEELAAMNPFPTVFARVSPEDKMKIVHALQSRQEVVSMTGDGVNDAPAIRHADVGVAMGITGTDLTKEVCEKKKKKKMFPHLFSKRPLILCSRMTTLLQLFALLQKDAESWTTSFFSWFICSLAIPEKFGPCSPVWLEAFHRY